VLLSEFGEEFEKLYGRDKVTMNMHLVSNHLAQVFHLLLNFDKAHIWRFFFIFFFLSLNIVSPFLCSEDNKTKFVLTACFILIAYEICENFGPVWGYWCYPFENVLGYIKAFVHGTKNPEKGFMFGDQVTRMLPVLEQKQFEFIFNNPSAVG